MKTDEQFIDTVLYYGLLALACIWTVLMVRS
jgi:hypothetical protein